jgi:hypothetical protein
LVKFFSKEGVCLGSLLNEFQLIHDITNISPSALARVFLDEFNVDQKLSWAAERQTTHEEDEVYEAHHHELAEIAKMDLTSTYAKRERS